MPQCFLRKSSEQHHCLGCTMSECMLARILTQRVSALRKSVSDVLPLHTRSSLNDSLDTLIMKHVP